MSTYGTGTVSETINKTDYTSKLEQQIVAKMAPAPKKHLTATEQNREGELSEQSFLNVSNVSVRLFYNVYIIRYH